MLNIVFTGVFAYPKGMAGTRRVQVIIDYFEGINISPKVLVLQRGQEGGRINLTEFKQIYFLRIALIFLQLMKWKKKGANNILYVYDGLNIQNIWVVLISKLQGYKVVVDIVEDYYWQKENASFLFRIKIFSSIILENLINIFADGVVVISTTLERKFSIITKDRIPLVHIPISSHINLKTGKKSFNNPIQFVYSGSFGNKDGLDVLFGAFNKVSRKYNNCKLFLTGTGKNLSSILQSNQNDNIIYVGYLEESEFYNLIANADVLCMTRNSTKYAAAGFPFKLGDYLATGNPVICSNVSDIELYLVNGEDSFIVKPDDIDELALAMEYVILNNENAIKVGQKGLSKCKMFFDPTNNGIKLHNFLTAL